MISYMPYFFFFIYFCLINIFTLRKKTKFFFSFNNLEVWNKIEKMESHKFLRLIIKTYSKIPNFLPYCFFLFFFFLFLFFIIESSNHQIKKKNKYIYVWKYYYNFYLIPFRKKKKGFCYWSFISFFIICKCEEPIQF